METHTPNGYDPRWLPVINQVLEDREASVCIVDLNDALWTLHVGPMIDAIEDGDFEDIVKKEGK